MQLAARECGLPEGVFSVLFGVGNDLGMALVRHPLVQAVGFTGSRRGGRALMDAAAARPEPIPVYAEMGSINPIFILPDAMKERGMEIAVGLHLSVTMGVGQFCTNPGLVFVPAGDEATAFVKKLQTLIAGTPPGTMLTKGICDAYYKGVKHFADVEGVSTLSVPTEAEGKTASAHASLFATDAVNFLQHSRELMEEVFGPVTLVVLL